MIARAVAVAKASNHNNSTSNYQRQETALQAEKDKALVQHDKDIFRSFWAGVHTSTIIHKDRLKFSQRKFRKSLNDSLVEQIFVDHSKEVSHPPLFALSSSPPPSPLLCLVDQTKASLRQ
jgi:hypothetical protein